MSTQSEAGQDAMGTTQSPRSDTRGRIIRVALELFSEQGYEQTSLREIADRLGVTKAALYYHFKTKDDIVHGIVDTMAAPIDEAIAWGEQKPWSPELRDELVRRFAAGMSERAPLLRFFHENQPALRDSPAGLEFKERMIAMIRLVHGPGASFEDRLRATMSLFTINSAMFLLKQGMTEASPGAAGDRCGEAQAEALAESLPAALTVALEIATLIEPKDD
ncbi:TetR/AcrR family transcriptional regulator [Kitasatospora sp. NBC_00240]|uniref:TetR/AcrR family transcriptional regulator n=1 Tax=Kitasatospora sp. NBC_00240 TaxID=2903567 RepID=UPI002258EB63|nr:TetR/AcrR family transcriptional regulator [Kitasatospora sp. NBC_00240]MCX5212184.1 TetR/AcrR family transcriptional regulator [Kitasatospora sp. NBC_00240]